MYGYQYNGKGRGQIYSLFKINFQRISRIAQREV